MHTNLKQKILHLWGISLISVFILASSAYADIAVIVHPGSGITTATDSDIKSVFLGKSSTINGKSVVPVEQNEGSSARATFNEKILEKSDSQLKAYWSKLIFSGKGSPPKSLADDAAVKAHVAGNTNAIGYIDSSKVDATVTVIFTIK